MGNYEGESCFLAAAAGLRHSRGPVWGPPRLHAGSTLPIEFIRAVEAILQREHLIPGKGYLPT